MLVHIPQIILKNHQITLRKSCSKKHTILQDDNKKQISTSKSESIKEEKVCTFFGHANSPESLRPQIHEAIRSLITEHQVDTFYVGSQGNFDRMALIELEKLSKEYPHIHYAIVLAYMPQQRREFEIVEKNTFLPEGIEEVHPRYAISWRNNWMADHADYVICFSQYSGRSARYITRAERRGCTIIRLSSTEE